MKLIFDEHELKGKTIKDIKFIDGCEKLGIIFDDSFCVFQSYNDEYFNYIELLTDVSNEELYELDLISKEEWNEFLEEEEREELKREKEERYIKYLQLKEEFEK